MTNAERLSKDMADTNAMLRACLPCECDHTIYNHTPSYNIAYSNVPMSVVSITHLHTDKYR